MLHTQYLLRIEYAGHRKYATLKHALLGLLAQEPSHGYDLKNVLLAALAALLPAWHAGRTSVLEVLRHE